MTITDMRTVTPLDTWRRMAKKAVKEQLRAYRDGTRKHEVMSLMAKPLTNDDIDNIVAWFSSLKLSVEPVR